MNLHEVSFEDYLNILSRSHVLRSWATPTGQSIHVVEYAGNDVLIITEPIQGNAVVIESNDANYGGSIHDQARHDRAAGR